MNVLNPFDGMSCGMIALVRAEIAVESYYASEIDKHAIKVSEANYPEIKRLGDVQLENVMMKRKYQDAISDLIGCKPIKINSALVSAQNRNRLYWTNIPDVTQPEDRGVTLPDVIGRRVISWLVGRGNNKSGPRAHSGKVGALTSSSWEYNNFVIHSKDRPHKAKPSKKAGCLTGGGNSGGNHSQMDVLVFGDFEIPLTSGGRIDIHQSDNVRRYSITECERLQTVPDRYTQDKGVSNSQCYKMLGNGWTVDVIAHIFNGLK